MAMGWMETIRLLGLDLIVATVFAVASLDVAACALKAAWSRIPRDAPSRGWLHHRSRQAGGVGNGINLSSASQRSATAPGRP